MTVVSTIPPGVLPLAVGPQGARFQPLVEGGRGIPLGYVVVVPPRPAGAHVAVPPGWCRGRADDRLGPPRGGGVGRPHPSGGGGRGAPVVLCDVVTS